MYGPEFNPWHLHILTPGASVSIALELGRQLLGTLWIDSLAESVNSRLQVQGKTLSQSNKVENEEDICV